MRFVAQVSIGTVIDPSTVNETLPSELSTIINKAMAHEQEQRHATAAELSDDLVTYLTTPTKRTVTQDRRGRLPHGRIFAATLAIAALATVFAVAPWRSSFPNPVYEWNGHFYALTESEVDWESAEAKAVSHGGHLITISSQEEQVFVESTFLTPPDRVFWIGMTDAEREGDWHWVSGEPVQYTNWAGKGEPNNVTSRHPITGSVVEEDYGVINWHFVLEGPNRRSCTWNDFYSIHSDDRVTGFRGIMEFAADPR